MLTQTVWVKGWHNDTSKLLRHLHPIHHNYEYVFQVKIPNFQSRYYHRAAAFSIGPELTEVVIFGGTFKNPKEWDCEHEDPLLGITVLQFGEYESMCVVT